MTALVGRDQELEIVESLLDGAGDDPPTSGRLVLRGDPGIGKSALLDAARTAAQERGMLVLSCTGIPTEARMAFAGLHQMLWPISACADALPVGQRDALLAALGQGDGSVPPVSVVGLAVVEVLHEAAQRHGPVLGIADDVQWLDRATGEVLAFAASRLEADPVALVAARREGEGDDEPLSQAGWPELRVQPLDAVASEEVLDSRARLDPVLRKRVLDEALGNPLALVELPIGLSERAGNAPSTSLPLTERLERMYAIRLNGLPQDTRTALLAIALDDEGAIPTALGAASLVMGEDVADDVLNPAVTAGLVDLDSPRVRFRHPLVRSAIHQTASVEQQRAMHIAFAETLDADPDRRVWHRAAAALGPDEDLADELEEAARRARRRGAGSVTISALERAAELSEQPERRAQLRLLAAREAFALGQSESTLRLIAEVEPADLTPQDRAALRYLRETTGPGRSGADVLGAFADIAEQMQREGDDEQVLATLVFPSIRAWWTNADPDVCRRIAATVEATGRRDDPRFAHILAMVDPIGHGRVVLDLLASRQPGAGEPDDDYHYSPAAPAVGAHDQALAFCAAATTGLRQRGELGHLGQTLLVQAWSAALIGRLDLASAAADEGGRLLAESANMFWVTGTTLVTGFVAARRGDADTANELAGQIEPFLQLANMPPMLAQVELVRGVASIAAGRFEEAYDHLARIFNPAEARYHSHLRAWALVDLAEAASHCGKHDEAAKLQAELITVAEVSGSPLLLADLAVTTPMLAEDQDAGALFDDALAVDLSAWPLHRARLLLAYGGWLRRRGQITESRVPLISARDTFDALGALVLSERARQELSAAGERSEQRVPRALENLSPQEWHIVQLAATGLSNREIGQQLYLSHRTVGSHLARIFPKLDITTRTQLAAAVATTAAT